MSYLSGCLFLFHIYRKVFCLFLVDTQYCNFSYGGISNRFLLCISIYYLPVFCRMNRLYTA